MESKYAVELVRDVFTFALLVVMQAVITYSGWASTDLAHPVRDVLLRKPGRIKGGQKMCKRKAEIGIGKRMYDECLRLFPSNKDAEIALGCDRQSLRNWREGLSPSAIFLSRLHFAGGDVLYVLTGRRNSDGK